jgi:tetratricopeptide (TPR) repeat protein
MAFSGNAALAQSLVEEDDTEVHSVGRTEGPEQAEDLHRRAVEVLLQGQPQAALGHLDKAVVLNPRAPVYHANRGSALWALGRRDEAEACFRTVLELVPSDVEAHGNLGKILAALGRPAEAEAHCRIAVQARPDDAGAWRVLAVVLAALRQLEGAQRCYREVLRLGVEDAPTIHSNLGNLLKDLGRLDDAEQSYRQAVRLRPEFPEALTNLGNLLVDRGQYEEAEACCRDAIRLRPDFPEPHSNLGNVLRALGRPEEAEASCREALRLRPGYLSALSNLGNALREQGKFVEAESCYRDAIRQKPDYVEALNNLGSLLYDQGRPEEAERAYRNVIELKPDYVDAHVNLALTLLLMGRFKEGWRQYEWRWERRKHELYRGFKQPLWDGGETSDRVLLLHAEQGFGDTLQFCRFVSAAAKGRRVVLEVQRPLVDLAKTLPGVEQVVSRGDPLPPFDLHCPLLSVPDRLGSSLETLPTAPYLSGDPTRVAVWRERVAPLRGLKVGLVWAGNPTMAADRRRSMCLDQLAPLGSVAGVSFVSLQKGPAETQAKDAPPGLVLHDWTEELRDFADTAALIEVLDLVIGVDTGVIHLAGALGKPVWLLNRFDRCWRWMADRDDSPWYPSLRQFRQKTPGEWGRVVDAVAAALQVSATAPPTTEASVRAVVDGLFADGLAHHKAGRRREAEAKYHAILALDPDHADGLHLLGIAALQSGKRELAVGYIREAIDRAPENGVYHGNLGAALKSLGRLAEAESSYREGLRLKPDFADAHSNLGNLLVDRGRAAEAEACYVAALTVQPNHLDALLNLANALTLLESWPGESGQGDKWSFCLTAAKMAADQESR